MPATLADTIVPESRAARGKVRLLSLLWEARRVRKGPEPMQQLPAKQVHGERAALTPPALGSPCGGWSGLSLRAAGVGIFWVQWLEVKQGYS